MLELFVTTLLTIFSLLLLILWPVYAELPVVELKRRARAHDTQARKLYRVVVYSDDFEVLSVILLGLSISGIFLLLTNSLPGWVTVVVFLLLIWLAYSVPRLTNSSTKEEFASLFAPLVATVLGYLHPIFSPISRRLHAVESSKTRLFQLEDLLHLVEHQAEQPENRIPKDQLKLVEGALTYADKQVRDIMVPKRLLVTAKATDAIGPVLLDELHDSGHSRFPVMNGDKPEQVVGILYLRDAINLKRGGKVRDIMKKEVYYAHEEFTLQKVLQAFLRTKHHLFMVINSFEEVVGIVTLEDVLEQIIGKPIIDEFDRYEDLREVAAQQAKHEHNEKVTEVIE